MADTNLYVCNTSSLSRLLFTSQKNVPRYSFVIRGSYIQLCTQFAERASQSFRTDELRTTAPPCTCASYQVTTTP